MIELKSALRMITVRRGLWTYLGNRQWLVACFDGTTAYVYSEVIK